MTCSSSSSSSSSNLLREREKNHFTLPSVSSFFISCCSLLASHILSDFNMPFFKKKSRKDKLEISGNSTSSAAAQSDPSNGASALPTTTSKQPKSILRSTGSANTNQNGSSQAGKTIFSCQLAHGSPTGRISGFNNVKDLYEKIATYYEIPVSTVSSHSLSLLI